MANEKRLIDANSLLSELEKFENPMPNKSGYDFLCGVATAITEIENATTVDAVEVPCKIGDFVWAIRSFKGKKHPQRGIVSDMFFTKDMKLMIVVKYVARGEWGKTVFATDKEAYAAIAERKDNERKAD